MAIPIWAALAAVKVVTTGAGIAYTLHRRRQEQDAPPGPVPRATKRSRDAMKKPDTPAQAPKGPVVIYLDDEDRS